MLTSIALPFMSNGLSPGTLRNYGVMELMCLDCCSEMETSLLQPLTSLVRQKQVLSDVNLIATTWGGEAKYYFNTRCWYAYAKFNTAPRLTPLTQFMDHLYGGRGWKVKSLEKHLPADIFHYCEQGQDKPPARTVG